MNWEDLKDSSEYAEVIGLLASLIAAVLALKKAEKEENSQSKDHSTDSALKIDNLASEPVDLHVKPVVNADFLMKPLDKGGHKLVISLCFVAVIQLAIILFIAYRLA